MPDNGPYVPEYKRTQRHIYDSEQWLSLGLAGLTIIVAICALIAIVATAAWGHSWYSPYCCNEGDCGPILKAEQRDGVWHYTNHAGTAAFDANTRIEQSQDGRTHACVWYGKLRCIYIPGGN